MTTRLLGALCCLVAVSGLLGGLFWLLGGKDALRALALIVVISVLMGLLCWGTYLLGRPA